MRYVPRLIAGILLAAAALQSAHGQTNPKGKVRTIEPAKDVTYFTEPLDANGNVDYFAALNIHLSKGITPENNAAALLWQVFGIERIPTRHVDTVTGPLEIKRSIPREQRFVTTLEFFRSKAPDAAPPPKLPANVIYLTPPESPAIEERRQRFNAACMNFWSDEEEPELKELLDRNKAALDQIVQAAARPGCFSPIYPDDEEDRATPLLLKTANLFDRLCSDAEKQLTSRAMRSAARGDTTAALQDLLAGHRLARHLQHGPFVSNLLTGSSLNARLRAAEQTFLSRVTLSSNDSRSFLRQLRQIAPPPSAVEFVDVGERLIILQAMQSQLVVRRPKKVNDQEIAIEDHTLKDDIPYEEPFRVFNKEYDKWVEAARLPGLIQQQARASEIAVETTETLGKVFRRFQQNVRQGHLEDLAKLSREDRLMVFTEQYLRMAPKDDLSFRSIATATVFRDLCDIAFSAAVYRAEKRSWPNGLSDLIPNILPAYPVDPFSGKSYHMLRKSGSRLSQTSSEIVFYSVGSNGRDDQGVFDPAADSPRDDFILKIAYEP